MLPSSSKMKMGEDKRKGLLEVMTQVSYIVVHLNGMAVSTLLLPSLCQTAFFESISSREFISLIQQLGQGCVFPPIM
jgi:hypothetical protein